MFFFFAFLQAYEDFPIRNPTKESDKNFSSYTFRYETPKEPGFSDFCAYTKYTTISKSTDPIQTIICEDSCSGETYSPFSFFCHEYVADLSMFDSGFHYFNTLDADGTYTLNPPATSYQNYFFENLSIAIQLCKRTLDFVSSPACQMVANAYALSTYFPQGIVYESYQEFFPLKDHSDDPLYNYSGWYAHQPFVEYPGNLSDFLANDDYIQTKFKYNQLLNFVVGKYHKYGDFLGFQRITLDLTRCDADNSVSQAWRRYAANFRQKCLFNLTELLYSQEEGQDILYDLWFQEEGTEILRPIPIVIKNYYDSTDSLSQEQELESSKLFRRFFLLDTYSGFSNISSQSYIQYASNITFVIRMKDEKSRILPPYVIFEYSRQTREAAQIVSENSTLLDEQSRPNKSGAGTPSFSFNVQYEMDYSSKFNQMKIVIIVFGVAGFIYWILKAVFYIKTHVEDGVDGNFLLEVFSRFLDIGGTVLLIGCCGASMWLLFFYRWNNKTPYASLPREETFEIFTIILWIAFAVKFISIIFRIPLQTNDYIFIIDWEAPLRPNVPVSAHRRILLANEYISLQMTRSFSIPMTLIITVFILDGCGVSLFSQAVPGKQLIDVGVPYPMLHFGLTSFIWLLCSLCEWLIVNLVRMVSKTFNRYEKFQRLCGTANCSVLIMPSPSVGFYIHGHSSWDHVEVPFDELTKNMALDGKGVSLKPLGNSEGQQCFAVYLTRDLRDQLSQAYDSVMNDSGKRAIKDGRVKSGVDFRKEAFGAFDSLNKFLINFLENQLENKKFEIRNSDFLEIAFGKAPRKHNMSVFTKRRTGAYNQVMIEGLQWTLCTMYLLLFAGLEIITNNACIPAFIIFFLDLIIRQIYKRLIVRNLAHKTLIDERFLLR